MIKNKRLYVIGLMSGTSCDGLSIAYCMISFTDRTINVINFENFPYSKKLQKRIINARDLKTREVVKLSFELGILWSEMIDDFIRKYKIDKIDLISSHGQTIYHSSKEKITYQIGEVEFITRRFKIPVAYDFRIGDMVLGGEGAPLIPFLDEFLFGNSNEPVCLLNIGGISNITVTGKDIKTYGFDTGPGNTLMDWAIRIYTNGRVSYDKDGKTASKGKVDYKKIERFLKNPFFKKKPPKSLDREEFGKDFVLNNFDFEREKIEDILATLNFFTAITIKEAVNRFVPFKISRLIASGGGVFNKTLIDNLKKLFNDISVLDISYYGIHPLSKEAAGFALLGAARFLNIPSNCPSVTGAKDKIVLGKISLP